jgi:sarcosine oxidase gamma subunit
MRRARRLLFGADVAAWLILSIIIWSSPDEWTIIAEVFLTLYALIAAAAIWAITAVVRRFAKPS